MKKRVNYRSLQYSRSLPLAGFFGHKFKRGDLLVGCSKALGWHPDRLAGGWGEVGI